MSTNPEALLISAVLRTGDHNAALNKGINKRCFHAYQEEWRWCERHLTRWKRLPSKGAFKAKYPEFPLKAVDDVEHFAEEVQREHARYMLTVAIDKSITAMETDDMEEAVRLLHAEVINIQSHMQGDGGDLDLLEDWSVMYEDVKRRVKANEKTGMSGLPTGFPTLDLLTGGPQAGDLWIIAARLGMGKTWTLIRLGTASFFTGSTVQYDTLEQASKQIGLRFHAFMASKYCKTMFRALDLNKGQNISLIEYKKFLLDVKDQIPGKLFISDQARGKVTPLTIAAQIERNKPDIVFIDYLSLMDSGDRAWQDIAKLSSELKLLAQRYEIPVVAAAQINRAGAGKQPPRTEHLGLSDAIGQDADCVVTMAQQTKSVMKMRLDKFRNGQDGDEWYCRFTPNTGQFDEVSGDKAADLMNDDELED